MTLKIVRMAVTRATQAASTYPGFLGSFETLA
jgi:hypothetical protein